METLNKLCCIFSNEFLLNNIDIGKFFIGWMKKNIGKSKLCGKVVFLDPAIYNNKERIFSGL